MLNKTFPSNIFLITNKTQLEAQEGKEAAVLFSWVSLQPGRLQLGPQG